MTVSNAPTTGSLGAVDLTTNQNVGGIKTLTSALVVPVAAGGTNPPRKEYVDAEITALLGIIKGLQAHPNVQWATTVALPTNVYASGVITGSALAALSIDSGSPAVGQRILVKNEAAAANNGLYVVTKAGGVAEAFVLGRVADMNEASEIPGAFVFVEEGTVNKATGWFVASPGPFTIGTTAIPWSQFTGAGDLSAGEGIAITGNQVSTTSGLMSAKDPAFGVVGDFKMTGAVITISEGSLKEGTLNTVPSDLIAGKTMIIVGLTAPLLVQAVNTGTKVVTFTTNASGAVASAWCGWGTDNTSKLNAFFAYIFENQLTGIWPSGKYLITGTVGWPDGGEGWAGGTIICGGAALNTALYGIKANLPHNGGTSLIWGGAKGGTMMAFHRIMHVHWVGGLSLVGQPSYSPSEVFTTFGNRAGIGYLVAQTGNPAIGTGYHFFDDLVVGDMYLGLQFAVGQSDNNCDTSRFNRIVANRCDQVFLASGGQQMAYTVGFAHFIKCKRGWVLAGGGTTDVQLLNLSGCIPAESREDSGATASNGGSVVTDSAVVASDVGRLVTGTNVPAACYVGTVTPGVSFTTVNGPGSVTAATMTGAVTGVTLGQVFSGVEARSEVNASNSRVGLMRIEQGTYGCIYVGGTSQLNIDSFEEALTEAANKNLFYIDGGSSPGGFLRIGQLNMFSYNETPSITNSPFYMGAAASRSGQLVIDEAMWNGPGSVIAKLQHYFFANANAYADITVRVLRDRSGNTQNPINTRLQRGKCFLYGSTTDATTAVTLQQGGLPVTDVFAYGPQVPKGYAIILITIFGDRGDGTFSRFQRQLNVFRTSGEATTSFTTPTGWTDTAEGTDQISTAAVSANKTLELKMKGTAAKTIAWQATVEMLAWTAATAP